MQKPVGQVRVWDLFVRLFHWTVAVAFFVAYFTEGEGEFELLLHVWAGYVVGALVLLRIVWGFAGPRHARFSDFVTSPVAGLRYLVDLVARRSPRYLGHSPAGGWMVVMVLAGLLLTVAAGMAAYAHQGKGPLAPLFAEAGPSLADTGASSMARADDDEGRREGGQNVYRELHEVLANLMFLFVVLHVAAVAWASLAHRENLVRAMITGNKRPPD